MLDDRWQMQASLLYYGYPTDRATRTFDRQEASLAWSYRDLLTFSLSTFNFPRADRSPWNVAFDITANVPLRNDVSLSLGAGSSRFPAMAYGAARSGRYQYGQVGLKWNRAGWTLKAERILTSGNTRACRAAPATCRGWARSPEPSDPHATFACLRALTWVTRHACTDE